MHEFAVCVRCFEVCKTSELPLGKDLICFVRGCCLCALFRGLKNLGAPCEEERVVTFCIVQKVTKKHAGLRPATSIQIAGRYVIITKVTGVHQVTGFAKIASFPGIAGNDLNRCDAPALQHKIKANSKRKAAFFAYSRLRVVGMGNGGWKRGVLDGKKERFVQKKGFLHIKRRFLRTVRKAFCKRKTFGL